MRRLAIFSLLLLFSPAAVALPSARDRIYTADQNSNTVSVIDPASNTLLGQIRLGNPTYAVSLAHGWVVSHRDSCDAPKA